jgi:hypothetical protein
MPVSPKAASTASGGHELPVIQSTPKHPVQVSHSPNPGTRGTTAAHPVRQGIGKRHWVDHARRNSGESQTVPPS